MCYFLLFFFFVVVAEIFFKTDFSVYFSCKDDETSSLFRAEWIFGVHAWGSLYILGGIVGWFIPLHCWIVPKCVCCCVVWMSIFWKSLYAQWHLKWVKSETLLTPLLNGADLSVLCVWAFWGSPCVLSGIWSQLSLKLYPLHCWAVLICLCCRVVCVSICCGCDPELCFCQFLWHSDRRASATDSLCLRVTNRKPPAQGNDRTSQVCAVCAVHYHMNDRTRCW